MAKNVREFTIAWEDAQCEDDRKELAESIWYDWFCSDKSLYSRTKKIIKPLKELLMRSKKVGEMQLNCCPISGPLYDCFRFFDKNDNHFNTDDYAAMVKKLSELLDA